MDPPRCISIILRKVLSKPCNISFAQKEGRLRHYVVLACGKKNNLKTLGTDSGYTKEMDIKGVHLLEGSSKLEFDRTKDGLLVSNMGDKTENFAHVLEIRI